MRKQKSKGGREKKEEMMNGCKGGWDRGAGGSEGGECFR